MGDFLSRLRWRLAQGMQGRNGMDELCAALMILSFIFLLLSTFLFPAFSIFALIPIIVCLARLYSRNVDARQRENEAYLKLISTPRRKIVLMRKKAANKETTVYFKCPQCKTVLSVPRGKGKIRVVCPKCKHETYRTT